MASKKQISHAWGKAKPMRGKDPDVWRKDRYGHKLRKGSYGTEGQFGWELDHKNPQSKGGSDRPQNVQPLHWQENRKKSDKYPYNKK